MEVEEKAIKAKQDEERLRIMTEEAENKRREAEALEE